MIERLTDEQLRDWRDEAETGAMMSPFETLSVLDALGALRARIEDMCKANEGMAAERDEAIRQSQGYLKHARELIDENDALRARVAELEAALEFEHEETKRLREIVLPLRAENDRLREACGGKMSDIGDAIQEMREGGKVRRTGWEGRWLELADDGMILLRSDQDEHTTWLALKDDAIAEDLLADDWEGLD